MKVIVFCLLAAFVLAAETSRDLESAASAEDLGYKNTKYLADTKIIYPIAMATATKEYTYRCHTWCQEYYGCHSWTWYPNKRCGLYAMPDPPTEYKKGSEWFSGLDVE